MCLAWASFICIRCMFVDFDKEFVSPLHWPFVPIRFRMLFANWLEYYTQSAHTRLIYSFLMPNERTRLVDVLHYTKILLFKMQLVYLIRWKLTRFPLAQLRPNHINHTMSVDLIKHQPIVSYFIIATGENRARRRILSFHLTAYGIFAAHAHGPMHEHNVPHSATNSRLRLIADDVSHSFTILIFSLHIVATTPEACLFALCVYVSSVGKSW